MNIISNSCLGGFIYRDILKQKYNVPFIWSLIPNEHFFNLIANYREINYEKYELLKESDGFSNNLYLLVDNQLEVYYHHIHFDKNCDKPMKIKSWNNIDIHTNKPWKLLVDTYEKRLNRFNKNDRTVFVFYDHFADKTVIEKLVNVCNTNKQLCLIFTNHDVQENKYVKKFSIKDEWLNAEGGWWPPLYNEYKNELYDILHSFSSQDIS